jgi:CubicO group peptidase (beta-lactamase class C family)
MYARRWRGAGRYALAAVAVFAGETPTIAQPASVPLQEIISPDAAKLGFSTERLKVIGAAYSRGVAAGEIPGAVVMIARDGRLAYSAAIGYRDIAAKQPMQLASRFYLASMTKPLTSVAAMMLVEEGRLLLDDPVAKYIPEFAALKVGREVTGADGKPSLVLEPPRRPPTVQDLLRHTSGFTYGPFGSSLVQQAYMKANVSDFSQTNAELVTKLAALPLAYQPGEVFEYSMSTDVLGRVVEVVSGMSLADFVKQRITNPLEMKDTSFSADDRSRVAALLGAPAPFPTGTRPRWFSGGGGMVGTAPDYLRFGQMMLGNGNWEGVRLLSPHSVALMTSNELPPEVRYGPYGLGSLAPTPEAGQGFGYGFAVRLEPGRNPAPGSVGDYHWAGSSGTYFWIDPRERLVAVVLTAAPAVRSAYRLKARQLVYQAMTVSRVSP